MPFLSLRRCFLGTQTQRPSWSERSRSRSEQFRCAFCRGCSRDVRWCMSRCTGASCVKLPHPQKLLPTALNVSRNVESRWPDKIGAGRSTPICVVCSQSFPWNSPLCRPHLHTGLDKPIVGAFGMTNLLFIAIQQLSIHPRKLVSGKVLEFEKVFTVDRCWRSCGFLVWKGPLTGLLTGLQPEPQGSWAPPKEHVRLMFVRAWICELL